MQEENNIFYLTITINHLKYEVIIIMTAHSLKHHTSLTTLNNNPQHKTNQQNTHIYISHPFLVIHHQCKCISNKYALITL